VDPAAALAARLASAPADPLLTHYDDVAGTRVELSATTLANGVAKGAGLLVDELGVQPGDEVGLLLPAHWQTAVALLACWWVGAVPVLGSGAGGVALVHQPLLADATADEVVGLALAPLGGPMRGAPAGTLDWGTATLAHPDRLPPRGPGVDVPAGPSLPEAARVLSALPWDDAPGVWWGLLGPLAAGGSIVLLTGPLDLAAAARRVQDERVTHVAGLAVPGLERVDG